MVDILEDGSFGEPKNLGDKINTEGRDTFPFISESGMLYFASNGHLGLGGLDIFVTKLDDEEAKVYNVGAPVNSSADDTTFIIDDATHKGYFASNRKPGKGDDDIYSFVEIAPLVTKCTGNIEIIVMNQATNSLLINADVSIKDQNGKEVYSGKTNENGVFLQPSDCNQKTYEILVSKNDFESISEKVTLTKKDKAAKKTFKLKSSLPKKGVDLAKVLSLKPIFFKSNKADILSDTATELEKVVAFMNTNKTIRIEIGSHTDSRGSSSYNLALSERRAKSTADYIIGKGIAASRVKSKGYGESVLKNKCADGTKCSDEQHQENRRSEFIVLDN